MKCSLILLEVKVHLVPPSPATTQPRYCLPSTVFSIRIKINYMGNNTMSYARPNTGKPLFFIMSKLCC